MTRVVAIGRSLLWYWLLPVVIVGTALPLGLVTLYVAGGREFQAAVRHGELFLAAGNAVVSSSLVLIATRRPGDTPAGPGVIIAYLLVVVPCYGYWAHIQSDVLLTRTFNSDLSTRGGAVAICVALILSFCFALTASRRQVV